MNNTNVAGHALYMEFNSPTADLGRIELIFTSPGVLEDAHKLVYPTTYVRQVYSETRRSYWKPGRLSKNIQINPATGAVELADSSLGWIDAANFTLDSFHRLDRLPGYNYKMSLIPVLVEMTQDDLKQVADFATPYKLINRIKKVIKVRESSDATASIS
jgi:hypothetical protein